MKSEKGQSLVEFALILPLLLFLVLGIIDFGRIFHAYITIDHAGREAARMASIGTSKGVTASQIEAYAKSKAVGLDTNNLTVGVSYQNDTTLKIRNVNVAISYPVDIYFPFIEAAMKKVDPSKEEIVVNLNDTTTMRVE